MRIDGMRSKQMQHWWRPAARSRPVVIKDTTAPNGQRQQTWRLQSRRVLALSHSWCGFVLGFNAPQLDRSHLYAGSGSEALLPQLQTLAALRVTDSAPETGTARKLANRAVLKPI